MYFLIFGYFLINSLIYDINQVRHKFWQVNIFFSFFMLAMVGGLRYKLGSDGFAYEYIFEHEVVSISQLDWGYLKESRTQPLWDILQSIAKYFDSFLLLQLLIAIFTTSSVYLFFYYMTPYISTCALLFYVAFYHYFSIEILRESLAISVFIISMLVFKTHKNISLLLCVLACFIHQFAVIGVAIHFLMRLKMSTLQNTIFAIVLVILIFLIREPLELIVFVFSILQDIDLSNLSLEVDLSLYGYLLYGLKITFPLVLIYYCISRKKQITHMLHNRILFMFCISISALYTIRITSIPYFERLVNYYMLPYIIVGGFVIVTFLRVQEPITRNVAFIILITLTTIFQWAPLMRPDPTTGMPGYVRYYPYYSYLNPTIDHRRNEAVKRRFSG